MSTPEYDPPDGPGDRGAEDPRVRRTALVVDDDKAIRNLVSVVLRREGFDIDTATDGVEAVLKLGLHEYDLIALDLMMPGVSGRDILAFLAEHKERMVARVLVMTAAGDADVIAATSRFPCRVVRKPFDLQNFVEVVRRTVQKQPC